ncbi:hypothetical protein [Sansalvadorimonas verongulae]|uniref:hypothetical protein n=1 Tax=Sansalvadorimonas verongulae TaxID=2172824 RepID=UPI0012BC90CB|nr:hypothetical protein [Sansalvadorimonas verongulae]MTI15378.1 hypothetical protein [Sansalvadorimonas verongulae]
MRNGVAVKRHDRFQLEICVENTDESRKQNIDMYLCFPKALDITPKTYRRSTFYRDKKSGLQLLPEMIDLTGSPLTCCRAIRVFLHPQSVSTDKDYRHLLKLFSCAFSRSLQRTLDNLDNDACEEFLAIDNNVRLMLALLRRHSPEGDKRQSYFRFLDGYLSTVMNQAYLSLFARLPDFQARQQLLNTIALEIKYREGAGLSSFDNSHRAGKAYRRLATQRKYSESVLHLENSSRPHGVLVQQMAYSLVAGLAMAIATVIAFWSQKRFGNLTMNFMICMVLGYMLKDRVKALGTSFTDRRLGRVLADYFGEATNKYSGKKMVSVREVVNFASQNGEEEPFLQGFLKEKRRFRPEHCVSILRYSRKLRLERQSLPPFITGVSDRTLVNVEAMLRNTAWESRSVYFLEGERVVTGSALPDYEVELLVHYGDEQRSTWKAYTLKVNRKGIRKVLEKKKWSFNETVNSKAEK